MPFHLDWNIGGGDEICVRQQHLFLSLPLFSLTCTATVLVWELMLALVSASGSPHIWQRCLMKEWSGIRTPTSWRAHEHLISLKLKEYHTKWETLFAEGQYCSSWWYNCECDFTFLWGKEKKNLTDVNGFRSGFSSSDLSNTRVTAPGSRSPNSAFCTGTLQYLLMQTPKRFAMSTNFTECIHYINKWWRTAGSCTRSTASFSHSLIDVLNFSDADGQWLLLISPLDVVGLPDCFRALGQARQAVDGVGGHADYVALLQSLCCAAQYFGLGCGE